MIVAFFTTRWPILVNQWFWPMAHEYRTDFAMSIGCIFIFIKGAGNWSLVKRIWN